MNPFTDWTEQQQCKGEYAFDATGQETDPTAPDAVLWCAFGRLDLMRIPEKQQLAFSDFCERRHCFQVHRLNDRHGWTPAQFAAAWDEFEKDSSQ